MSPNLKLRSPTVLAAIGVAATLLLSLAVVLILVRTGGAKAVSDNAALIGALVALGGVFTAQMVSIALEDRRTQAQRKRELEVERERAQSDALETYLDRIGDLLVEVKKPEKPLDYETFSKLVQARTLLVLRSLGRSRKRQPLMLIAQLELINRDGPLISLKNAGLDDADLHEVTLLNVSLQEADLRLTDLTGADLRGSDLMWADLRGADLTRAVLTGACLAGANLLPYDRLNPAQLKPPHLYNGAEASHVDEKKLRELRKFNDIHLTVTSLAEANLQGADLSGAFLYGANLAYADLTGTVLTDADLRRADLSGAVGVNAEVLEQQTSSLEGATMPNGQKYEDWIQTPEGQKYLKDKEARGEDGENSSPQ